MLKSKTLKINSENDLMFITFPNLSETGLVRHAFSTRLGGVSHGIYRSMNLSPSNGDDRKNVLKNYEILCNAIGADYKKCVLSHQTHTVNLRVVNETDIGKGIFCARDYDDVDGLITNVPGVVLVTQYADCVPLLFLDPINKVIASSHAGWRGTVNKIGALTIQRMVSEFGSRPEDVLVGIAPSIMQCCFEVDEPVYADFCHIDGVDIKDVCIENNNGKYNIDLQNTNRMILENAGVLPKNITVTDICTKCHNDIFHSHRATNGKRGNLAALISLI